MISNYCYSRHILLQEIGIEGQEKLTAAHALIIGASGLAPAALFLAASGVGTLTICDNDVEPHQPAAPDPIAPASAGAKWIRRATRRNQPRCASTA
jgi:hypothetical protein